jgi:hypothetical protein
MSEHPQKYEVPAEFLELVTRFLNGPLREGDLDTLSEQLRSSAQLRVCFCQLTELDAMLVERTLDGQQALRVLPDMPLSQYEDDSSASSLNDATVLRAIHDEDVTDEQEQAIDPPAPIPPRTAETNHLPRIIKISAAAMVLITVGVTGYLLHRPRLQPVTPGVAVVQPKELPAILAAAINAQFKSNAGAAAPAVGSALSLEPLQLESGWIKLDLANGVSTIVEGPARFQIQSGALIHLDQGCLTAHVPQQGRGFTVETGACRVMDLGTDFGVDVSSTGKNQVQVFEGQIALSQPVSGNSVSTPPASIVTAGHALEVVQAGAPSVEIPSQPSHFVRVNQFDRWQAALSNSSQDQVAAYYEQLARAPGLSLLYLPDSANPAILKNRATATAGSFDMPIAGPDVPSIVQGHSVGLSALRFDATKRQGLDIPSYPATQTGSVSGVVWINLHSYVPYGSIIKSWGDTKAGVFHFGLDGSGRRLEIELDGATPSGPVLSESQDLPLNQWIQVAFISDGSTVRLYRDGKQVAEGPSRPISREQSAHVLSIGFKTGDDEFNPSSGLAVGFWDGDIGEIAIFDRALSADEILRISQPGRP